jgi:2-oxoisovalerate dehydrogenase E1 component
MSAADLVAASAAADPRSSAHAIAATAVRIRAFERALLDLFKDGQLSGTVHTCIGQELCAAALHPHLRPGVDAFFATHRGHGHYLASQGPADALLAELMGRDGALCAGRGGTQNLQHGRFFSSGIQGGSTPIAPGYAWARARRGGDAIAVVQIGDGTIGEGTVYEALAFAVLLKAPVLFLLEWNGWAQSTDVRATTPGDILDRARGFGVPAHRISDDDPVRLSQHLGEIVERVRRGGPFLQVIDTRRLMAHSKGDDNRSPDLVDALWRTDPIARLLAADVDVRACAADAERETAATVAMVKSRPLLSLGDARALPQSSVVRRSVDLHSDRGDRTWGRGADELNRALHALMQADGDVILLGEDLLDPYGGAFKVSRGLSTCFPGQVFSTPIAEAAIVGVANGMALAGLKPIAEIMFADFVTLAADQLINFAAKFHYMYAGRVTCPITVRLASGGGRGYGPTHSQSLERLFCGIPGLRVVAVSQRHDAARLLTDVVATDESPVVFVEHKALYGLKPMQTPPLDCGIVAAERSNGDYPPLCYTPLNQGLADVTVVTYGGTTAMVERAMQTLVEDHELRFDYIVLTQLWPLDVSEIVASVRRTGRLLVVEESVAAFGIASAVIAAAAQQMSGPFLSRAVGSLSVPIPSARHLEDEVLPSTETVVHAVVDML